MNKRFATVSVLILLAAFSRLLPHPPNVAPIAAMALFGGAYFGKRFIAFLVPLAAMFLSDLAIGFHPTMVWVYVSFAVTVLIGMTLRNRKTIISIVVASILSSVTFFLITNFADWIAYYPNTYAGLVECYTLAIPFFRNSLMGNLFFTAVLFGGFYLLEKRIPQLAPSKA